jgi:hypothetical protein
MKGKTNSTEDPVESSFEDTSQKLFSLGSMLPYSCSWNKERMGYYVF